MPINAPDDERLGVATRPQQPSSERSAAEDKMARRAALSAFVGTVIEYYDFLIFGVAAALVFGPLFFPVGAPGAGTLAALATFGIAYLARPLGAVIFGHFGDRKGRRTVLMVTLVMMGISSTAIGVLPTYESVGVLAPILLVLCRIGQGLSAGGEQTGASLLTMEHASPQKKSLYASWTPNGAAVGSALATAVFIPIAALPEDALLSWGWRVPFLLSAITLGFAIYLRSGVAESPEYAAKQANANSEAPMAKTPLLVVFRRHPRAVLCVMGCVFLHTIAPFFSVFGLAFASQDGHVGRTPMLVAITVSQIVSIFFIPMWASRADRLNKKWVYVIGALVCPPACALLLAAIASGSMILTLAAATLLMGIIYPAPYGIWPVFFSRQFPLKLRYTGTGVAMQIGLLVMGSVPAICVSLLDVGTLGWWPVIGFMTITCGIAATAAALSREAAPEDEVETQTTQPTSDRHTDAAR